MAEQLSNKGYFAIGVEATKGTAVTPSDYLPLYDESFITDIALDLDNPVIGNKAEVYQTLLGLRTHGGEATILAEPNTAARVFDMFMTAGNITGADPYTHPFTISNTVDPLSYTIDIAKGGVVHRFIGCEISEFGMDFDTNKMVFKLSFSGLSSMIVREVVSVSTATVTLNTNYDPAPNVGFVDADLIQFLDVSAGTVQDFTVASIDNNGIDFDASGSPSGLIAGDLVYLRPATPTYVLLAPFNWARTEFRFSSVDAATALTAGQTRLEQGSQWTLMHKFEANEGAQRSGSFDPAALIRGQVMAELEAKVFFDTPEDKNLFLTNQKKAVVIRHFSGDDKELRITLNNVRFQEHPNPVNTGEIIYAEGKFVAAYDSSDAQVMDIKVINALADID